MNGCPHCGHLWFNHRVNRCDICGCMWQEPEPPKPPKPEVDPLADRVEDALWSAFEDVSKAGMGFYVDRNMDMIDGSGSGIHMAAVASHLIASLGLQHD